MTGMHFIVKGKIASYLREEGYQIGLENSLEENKELIETRKRLIDSEANAKVIKSRITKKIKKENPGLSKKEIDHLVNDELDTVTTEKSSDITITPIFNKFKITTYVSPPTARRLDPANLWPTVKHIVDGLTDCGFWIDDDWEHLEEISFKYDGINITKDSFIIKLVIEEIRGN